MLEVLPIAPLSPRAYQVLSFQPVTVLRLPLSVGELLAIEGCVSVVTAVLFPGQGVQSPGMDGELASLAPGPFEIASRVLDVDVIDLCRAGECGDASLSSTRWAQPAVLVCSVAAHRALVDRGTTFTSAAGHSVGEYAALVASGAMDLEEALECVALRARFTEEAARVTPGSMAALMRVGLSVVHGICEETGAALASDNAPGQYVVSGPVDAVELACRRAAEEGAVVRRLEVSGAFHSPVMERARAPFAHALETIRIERPAIELWSSVTGSAIHDPAEIREALVDQLTAPVRWREVVGAMAEAGHLELVDAGPGRVVGGLARRIAPKAEVRYASEILASSGVVA
jgi:[acyl-carrier-protein] S-malonyltransferase